MSTTIIRTEHETEIQVHDTEGYDWVDLTHYNPLSGALRIISLTAEEARKIADALLSASQRVEDRIPHTNC